MSTDYVALEQRDGNNAREAMTEGNLQGNVNEPIQNATLPAPRVYHDYGDGRVDMRHDMNNTSFMPSRKSMPVSMNASMSNRDHFNTSFEELNRREAKPAAPAPRVGDAGPLALLAFGGTTALYCSHVAGKSEMNMTTMGMVLAYGGLVQIICGIFELINRNTFPGTAFMTYGAFWLASAFETLIPSTMPAATAQYGGGHALVWFFITFIFLGSSLTMPFMCIMVFFLLDIFFLLLAIGTFRSNDKVTHAAGYEGIVTGAFAMYAAAGMLLRDVYGRTIIPLIDHDGVKFYLYKK